MFQNFLLCLPLGFAVVAFDAAAFERTVTTILAGIDGFFSLPYPVALFLFIPVMAVIYDDLTPLAIIFIKLTKALIISIICF